MAAQSESLNAGDTTTTSSSDWKRPRFSWDTLPVFFHSRNKTNGAWSDAVLKQIIRFPLVTSGTTGMRLPDGSMQSMEIAAPEICRRVSAASNGTTQTFSYVNSVIDWPTNFKLHEDMVANPDWRLKHDNGSDWHVVGNNWVYNLSHPDMRARWIEECVSTTEQGCTGCFIDQANDKESFGESPAAQAYSRDHLATLVELSERLEGTGHFVIDNHLGDEGDHVKMMMIEDFAGSEKCIKLLQTVAARGIAIEAHAGNEPANYSCVHAGTNSLAAFLIGAGEYSYYHCQGPPLTWVTQSDWPEVADESLDWIPEYDYKLGAPLGVATTRPSTTGKNASLWSRHFASGTRVEFDGGNGNGTIWWADGPVQVGSSSSTDPTVLANGCKWETDKP